MYTVLMTIMTLFDRRLMKDSLSVYGEGKVRVDGKEIYERRMD